MNDPDREPEAMERAWKSVPIGATTRGHFLAGWFARESESAPEREAMERVVAEARRYLDNLPKGGYPGLAPLYAAVEDLDLARAPKGEEAKMEFRTGSEWEDVDNGLQEKEWEARVRAITDEQIALRASDDHERIQAIEKRLADVCDGQMETERDVGAMDKRIAALEGRAPSAGPDVVSGIMRRLNDLECADHESLADLLVRLAVLETQVKKIRSFGALSVSPEGGVRLTALESRLGVGEKGGTEKAGVWCDTCMAWYPADSAHAMEVGHPPAPRAGAEENRICHHTIEEIHEIQSAAAERGRRAGIENASSRLVELGWTVPAEIIRALLTPNPAGAPEAATNEFRDNTGVSG